MKLNEKVYLIGLGAIGSIVAGKIHDTCPGCLKIISDGERLEKYLKNGYSINNKPYKFDFIRPEDAHEPADLIIIAVKNHHLLKSLNDIRGIVGPDTIIISLLNGISSEEIIADKFKRNKVLYSFYVGTDALRTGTSTSYSSTGKIVFGDKGAEGMTPSVAAVKELFDKTGIPYEIPEDILHEQWWKFMGNVGVQNILRRF